MLQEIQRIDDKAMADDIYSHALLAPELAATATAWIKPEPNRHSP